MSRTLQLALALLGTAITAVVVAPYARNVDHPVAEPPSAAFSVHASDRPRSAGRRAASGPEVVAADRLAAIPAGGRVRGAPAGDPGDVADEPTPATSEAQHSRVDTIERATSIDETSAGEGSPAAGRGASFSMGVPLTATTQSATTRTSATGCKHTPAPHPQGATARVEFVGVLLDGQQREGDRFTGAELDDLMILVEWHSLVQNHAQRVDLFVPDGSLYKSLSRVVTAADEGARLETRVPVNGTWITRYGLYGAWCVEVFLDEQSAPVTSTRLVIAKPQ